MEFPPVPCSVASSPSLLAAAQPLGLATFRPAWASFGRSFCTGTCNGPLCTWKRRSSKFDHYCVLLVPLFWAPKSRVGWMRAELYLYVAGHLSAAVYLCGFWDTEGTANWKLPPTETGRVVKTSFSSGRPSLSVQRERPHLAAVLLLLLRPPSWLLVRASNCLQLVTGLHLKPQSSILCSLSMCAARLAARQLSTIDSLFPFGRQPAAGVCPAAEWGNLCVSSSSRKAPSLPKAGQRNELRAKRKRVRVKIPKILPAKPSDSLQWRHSFRSQTPASVSCWRPSLCCTSPLLSRRSAALLHCCTAALLLCCSAALLLCCFAALLHLCTCVQLCNGQLLAPFCPDCLHWGHTRRSMSPKGATKHPAG